MTDDNISRALLLLRIDNMIRDTRDTHERVMGQVIRDEVRRFPTSAAAQSRETDLIEALRKYDVDVRTGGRCPECHLEDALHAEDCPWEWIRAAAKARKGGVR